MRSTSFSHLSRLLPTLRAVTVITAVVAMAGGVTYAALQSPQVKLTGSTIQTATANLEVSADGVSYAASQPGYVFGALVPGGQATPLDGYPVYLKNTGGTPLALKLAVSSLPANPDSVDFTKVHVIVTPSNGGSIQNFTLQSLVANSGAGGSSILVPTQLAPGAIAQYKLQVSMEADAMSGPSATINNIDFSFSGATPVN
jgi:hypothetical protein